MSSSCSTPHLQEIYVSRRRRSKQCLGLTSTTCGYSTRPGRRPPRSTLQEGPLRRGYISLSSSRKKKATWAGWPERHVDTCRAHRPTLSSKAIRKASTYYESRVGPVENNKQPQAAC